MSRSFFTQLFVAVLASTLLASQTSANPLDAKTEANIKRAITDGFEANSTLPSGAFSVGNLKVTESGATTSYHGEVLDSKFFTFTILADAPLNFNELNALAIESLPIESYEIEHVVSGKCTAIVNDMFVSVLCVNLMLPDDESVYSFQSTTFLN